MVRVASNISVPLEVRSHELNQLKEMVPTVEARLRRVDLADRADAVAEAFEEHIKDVDEADEESFAAYVSMPTEDWWEVIDALERIEDDEGYRVRWLRAKLARRLRDRLEVFES